MLRKEALEKGNQAIDFSNLTPDQITSLENAINEMEKSKAHEFDTYIKEISPSTLLHIIKREGKNPDTKRVYYEIEYAELARGHNPVHHVARVEKLNDGRLLIDAHPGFISKQYKAGGNQRGITQERKIIEYMMQVREEKKQQSHIKLKDLPVENRLYFTKIRGKTVDKFMEDLLSNLSKEKQKGNPAYPLESLFVFQSLLRSIKSLHEVGILHLDVKPENIMTEKKGDQYVSKAIDFDISQIKGKVSIGDVMGTLLYVAPEFNREDNNQNISEKSDVYSLGMILLKMMGGKSKRESYESIYSLVIEMNTNLEALIEKVPVDIPLSIQTLIINMLKLDPNQRMSLDEAIEELDRIIINVSQEANPRLGDTYQGTYNAANMLRQANRKKGIVPPADIINTLQKLTKDLDTSSEKEMIHMFLNTLQVTALYGCHSLYSVKEKIDDIYNKAKETIQLFENEIKNIGEKEAKKNLSSGPLFAGATKFVISIETAMKNGDLDMLVQFIERAPKKLDRLQIRMINEEKKHHFLFSKEEMQEKLSQLLQQYSSSSKHSRETTVARLMGMDVNSFKDKKQYLQLLVLEYHAIMADISDSSSKFFKPKKSEVATILNKLLNTQGISVQSTHQLSFNQPPFDGLSPLEEKKFKCVFELLKYAAQHETKKRSKLGDSDNLLRIKWASSLASTIYSLDANQQKMMDYVQGELGQINQLTKLFSDSNLPRILTNFRDAIVENQPSYKMQK